MPNGRCRMHGGKSTGAPIKHGRYSKYVRIFGESFAALLADPDLLRSDSELALHDAFLLERAELLGDGVSADWLAELRSALEALRKALFVTPDGAAARAAFGRLDKLVTAGGERAQAWVEMLDTARQRSELASRAEAALARRDQAMTESQMVVMFGEMLRILVDVAGADAAGRVKDRFEREVLGRVGEGVRIRPGPAAN